MNFKEKNAVYCDNQFLFHLSGTVVTDFTGVIDFSTRKFMSKIDGNFFAAFIIDLMTAVVNGFK